MMRPLDSYNEIWVADFEFIAQPGELPEPVCLAAKELRSGKWKTQWLAGVADPSPPYSTGSDSLFICYFASAEVGCHLQLGWDVPTNIVDLYTEFRNYTNGIPTPSGAGLLGAMTFFGIPGCTATEKDQMRDLVLQGGPWTPAQQDSIMSYCMSDVDACAQLFQVMEDLIDLPRARLRGRYMAAVAQMEHNGIPIDVVNYRRLTKNWDDIKSQLIREIDTPFGVYDGLTFKTDRWVQWVTDKNIDWPLTEAGHVKLDDDTFKNLAKVYPEISPIRDLRYILGQLKLNDLAIGSDARNRCLLSPFRAVTGRNQPSSAKFIFGPAIWLRNLIRPKPGTGIAYVDFSQQEFAIAAALSNDAVMQEAYLSGDPYMSFARQAGAVPESATRETHARERELFKQCALATQYGMGAHGLARRIGQPLPYAQELLDLHKKTYTQFWKWSDAVVAYASLHNKLWTRFGWTYHIGEAVKVRTLRNFPMQANGAEMLRIACCLAIESGVKVCAPIHDALLIEASIDDLPHAIHQTQKAMARASIIVLDGFELRTDVDSYTYPNHYDDPRGRPMWKKVMELLEVCERDECQ